MVTQRQYPNFKQADVRRLLVVALAIWESPRAVLGDLTSSTGMANQSVIDTIARLSQLGIVISKEGPIYRLDDWGPLLAGQRVKAFIEAQGKSEQNALGNQIASLRRMLGLTQADFWTSIGVAQTRGSRYETGAEVPGRVLTMLAERYGFEVKNAEG